MTQKAPKSQHYDAFISYRHIDPDQKIACSLLKLLEALPLKGRKKFHIFRDKEEFPTSSDLGNDIHRALEASDFLILICSPEYLQSKWCQEELAYFRKLHGGSNRNILPILVSGEPVEAFPEELFTQVEERIAPDGSAERYTRHIEPLGADVRGKTIRKSKKKLRDTEYLRIAAAMLNCRFDDLYRREQRRMRRKLALGSAGIAAAASVMISFLLWQLFQVKQAQLHEQLTYAQRSFDSGDRLRARESTLEILDDYFWPMDASIRDGAGKLEYITGYTPQFSVVTGISQNISNHRSFFSSDGSSLLEWDYTGLTRYCLKGEVLSRFSLGAKGQKISAVSPDGTRAAIVRMDSNGVQNMDLWDTEGEICLGTLLECASADIRTKFMAEFSPDGASLSVWCQGGISNEQLCLFDAQTGRELCSLDSSLLGSLNDGQTIENFTFRSADLAHWTGGANEVFYSLSQKSVLQIPRYWASQYARTFSGACPAFGRYAIVDAGYGVEVLDLAQLNQELFQGLLQMQQLDAKPVQELHGMLAAYVQTVTLKNDREVLSGFGVVDLSNPERAIEINGIEKYGWNNPVFYSSKDSSVVYLSVTGKKQELIRINLDKLEVDRFPCDQNYQRILFLGSGNGQDFFAGSTGERTVLLSINEEGLLRQREVELSLSQLEQHDLALTPEGVCLIAPYQGSNCLFSMESEARQLDEQRTETPSEFWVSADGGKWLCTQGSVVTGCWDGELKLQDKGGKEDKIRCAGVSPNGNGFVASTKEILVFRADGSELFRQIQEENGLLFDAIRSARLSENGAYLYWLTSPSVSSSNIKRNTCRLHSLELESVTVTDYPFDVLWLGDYPAEQMYDCSPDGKQAVFLSATTIPQLRLLQVNQTDTAKWADSTPFDALNLPSSEVLSGVAFADEERIVCTAGNAAAIVDAVTLKGIWGVAEQASGGRLPQLWPDGTLVYFGSSLDFWDTSTGELLGSLSADAEASLTRSRDGKWFVLSTDSGTVLYDAQTRLPMDLLSSTPLRIHLLTEDCTVYSDGWHLYQLDNR